MSCFKDCDDERLKAIFDQWDKDDSGFISRKELLDVLMALKDKMGIDEDECKASTKDILDKCDAAGTDDDKMSFEEFKAVLC